MDRFQEIRQQAQQRRASRQAPADGAAAWRRGFTLADNPHPLTEPERGQWRRDWLDARDDNAAGS